MVFKIFFVRYIVMCFRRLTTQQGLAGNHKSYRVNLEAIITELHTDMDGHLGIDLV